MFQPLKIGLRGWLSLLIALGLLAAGVPLQKGMVRAIGSGSDPTELALFPTGSWVRPLAFGRTALAADLTWLEAIQYYGEHHGTDQSYPYVETLFETLFTFDPQFENAYLFGALILAEDLKDLPAALAMLDLGIEKNPESWRLVFEAGFLRYLHGRDPDGAAPYLERSSRMPGSPDWTRRLAAYSAKKAGRHEMAIRLWWEIYRETENKEIRRVARDYLLELGVEESRFPEGED